MASVRASLTRRAYCAGTHAAGADRTPSPFLRKTKAPASDCLPPVETRESIPSAMWPSRYSAANREREEWTSPGRRRGPVRVGPRNIVIQPLAVGHDGVKQ